MDAAPDLFRGYFNFKDRSEFLTGASDYKNHQERVKK